MTEVFFAACYYSLEKLVLKNFILEKADPSLKYWVLTIFVKKTTVKTRVYVICDTYT